jgi:hypothetical protein
MSFWGFKVANVRLSILMSTRRQRTPQEKKALAYEKDHVPISEFPHALRKTLPRLKAIAHREERHRVSQMLGELKLEGADDKRGDFPTEPVRPDKVGKRYGVRSLREKIAWRFERRVEEIGWNFFKNRYDRQRHHEAFANFLRALTDSKTRSEYSRKVALLFRDMMDPPPRRTTLDPAWRWNMRHNQWLRNFFQDEPEWETRLRAWISTNVEEHD